MVAESEPAPPFGSVEQETKKLRSRISAGYVLLDHQREQPDRSEWNVAESVPVEIVTLIAVPVFPGNGSRRLTVRAHVERIALEAVPRNSVSSASARTCTAHPSARNWFR